MWPQHRDASAGIPLSQGGTGVPVPCPEPRGAQRCPPCSTQRQDVELGAGDHLGSGGECQVTIPACFLVPVRLQRWMEPSHLCHTATGKGQGMMLLRSPPPPAHPAAAPALVPIPARPFPPRSSFPVVFWACLFAAFADSAQPCCPPDSSHSSGHGPARPHPAHSPVPRQAHLCPAGLCHSPPGRVAELTQSLPATAALARAGRGAHAAPAPLMCRGGWRALPREAPKPPPVLRGSPQIVPQDQREV